MPDVLAQKQVSVLAALAQATRLQILARVAQAGPRGMAAGDIARSVRCPASTLSFHLKELSRTGLLESRPRGRFVIYVLRREVLGDLAHYLAGLGGDGQVGKPRRTAARRSKAAHATDRGQLSIFGE